MIIRDQDRFSFRSDNLNERNLTVLYNQNYDEPTVLPENKSPIMFIMIKMQQYLPIFRIKWNIAL